MTTKPPASSSQVGRGDAPLPPFTPRTALILLIAVLTGIGCGALTVLAGRAAADGVLAGVAAAAAAIKICAGLIRE